MVDAARVDLFLFPAPVGWALTQKFQMLRDLLGLDAAVFFDRREWIYLASIEADAARLTA